MPTDAADPGAGYAEQEVSDRLRELAANIIRVTRGAGRSFELPMQAHAFLDAMARYRDAVGHFPPADRLKRALSIDAPSPEYAPVGRLEELHAQKTIVRGALQVAASRLLEQGAEEAIGEAEILSGIRQFDEAEAAARRRREAEQEASMAALRAKQKARRLELKEIRAAEEARKAAARERRDKRNN